MKKIMISKIFIFIISIACLTIFPIEKHVIGSRNEGFFSNFLGALNHLVWCDKNNKVPVVYWDKILFYYQPEGYNGSTNAWEYYFKPVSTEHCQPGDSINRQYYAPDGYGIPYNGNSFKLNLNFELRQFMYSIIKKYISLNQLVEDKIKVFLQHNMTGKKTVGIHVRGTDKWKEAPIIPLIKFINEANKFKECQFLIATDEYKILEELKEKLDGPVIYYDALRSHNSKPIHRNNAVIGEDVLIEAQLLSKCDIFIHSMSNVAISVLFFNPRLQTIFLE